MASSLNENAPTLKDKNRNSKVCKDLVKTIHGAFEMALFVKRNRYDQNILDKSNNK